MKGGSELDIEIKVDSNYKQPVVVIYTDKITDDINSLVDKLSNKNATILTGIFNEQIEVIKLEDLIRIYSANGKVYAITKDKEYVLKKRLYELEEALDPNKFIRISNSEIVNIHKIKKFDFSISGTIIIEMEHNNRSYVSRRYVYKIKNLLGMGGKNNENGKESDN